MPTKRAHRIALVSLFHLANNIRLVKEADALTKAGYEVDVFAAQYLPWAEAGDAALMQNAQWRAHFISYERKRNPLLFWYSRFRRKVASQLWNLLRHTAPSLINDALTIRALDRILPEMQSLVRQHQADLYIGHGTQSLPVVIEAARHNQAIAGFDSEDFVRGMRNTDGCPTLEEELIEFVDTQYLPHVRHLTAASPGVAEALAQVYPGLRATPILNVFSLHERPVAIRHSQGGEPLRLYWVSQTIGRDRGLEEAVRACALLPARSIELHLRGNWQNGYEEELRDYWREHVGSDANLFVHEILPPNQLVRAAAEYDVGLALEIPVSENRRICMRDLCTNKVFTYLLGGLAIAASGFEERSSIFEGAGFAYRTGDSAQLAAGLEKWIANRDALSAAREKAWRISEQKFNWDIEQTRFLALAEKTLAGETIAA